MHGNWWHTRSFEDFFNSVVNIFVKAGIKDDEPNIDRVHSKGKQYLNKKLGKNVNLCSPNLLHSVIVLKLIDKTRT